LHDEVLDAVEYRGSLFDLLLDLRRARLGRFNFFAADSQNVKYVANLAYKGRVGIYQVMPISDDMQRLILADASAMDIAEQAQKENVCSLRQSGLHKVKIGMTSLEEVIAVTNE
jgi:type II secretory ATPase GspE/PulE/Tfp pilus assembly ATPase PilB-like protein